MKAKVVFAEDFRDDVEAQVRWLVAEDRPDQAARLIDEIDLAAKLLTATPLAGPVDTVSEGRKLRKVVLRGLPFMVWYFFQRRPAKIVMLRLFHSRQGRRR